MGASSKALVAVLATTILGGCATGFKATHDHDASHDFNKYQTFAWISENPMKIGQTAVVPNPLLQPRIMRAVEQSLVAKGYRQVDKPKAADFVVSFTVGSREKVRVDSYPTMSMGYSTGYPGHWRWGAAYHCCASYTRVREYTKGILAVDVFDVQERRPVWHGVASKTINESDRENIEETVRAAVDAVLAGFPPT